MHYDFSNDHFHSKIHSNEIELAESMNQVLSAHWKRKDVTVSTRRQNLELVFDRKFILFDFPNDNSDGKSTSKRVIVKKLNWVDKDSIEMIMRTKKLLDWCQMMFSKIKIVRKFAAFYKRKIKGFPKLGKFQGFLKV